MRKTRIWTAVILAAAVTLTGVGVYAVGQTVPVGGEPALSRTRVLIDPGHGGEDGGTMAKNGTLEKEINLAISLPLADLLRLWGYEVTLTRETDISIYDPDAATVREKKVSDLKKRLALYEQAQLVVSIHENHFSGTQYYGTQVFYSPNAPASQPLAASIRESVRTLLQPENTRELKKGDKTIYLLHKTTVPAVLVECGFLSNEAERTKLETPAYQQQMALAIGLGLLHYGAGT